MSWGGATVFIQQKVTPPAPHSGGNNGEVAGVEPLLSTP